MPVACSTIKLGLAPVPVPSISVVKQLMHAFIALGYFDIRKFKRPNDIQYSVFNEAGKYVTI